MTQIVIAAEGDNETNKRNVVIAFGVLYAVFSIIQYALHVYFHYKAHEGRIQSNSNNARHKFRAMCFLNFLLLLASALCFSGDNMHIFGEQNKEVGIASVCLLFIGLIGFRLIPVLKDEINNHFNENNNNDEAGRWKILKKSVNILQLAPEIDGWFTHFAALVLLHQNSSCYAIWAISVIIIILAVCPIFFPALRFYNLPANERNFAEKFQLALYICMWFIVGFLLIGDNNQPLDCTISLTSNSYTTGNIIRAIFSAFTFIISATLLIIAAVHGKKHPAPVGPAPVNQLPVNPVPLDPQ